MKYGVIITGGLVREQVELARTAEAAGWDGVFTWDGIHVGDQVEVHDPWVLMGAFAMATERVRIGAIIQPLSRRRPWKVARESVTLDHVSNGRFVLCVGLGAVDDSGWGKVGEETDRRIRAERLDETLQILVGLWTGEPFGFSGQHYRFRPMAFKPTPIQQPRIPIWVVGAWPRPKSMKRAAKWDGVIPSISADPFRSVTPDEVREIREWLVTHRTDPGIGEIVIEGVSPGDDPAWVDSELRPLAEAGATWWIESRWEAPNDIETLRRRIRQGPPQLQDGIG